MVEVLYGTLYTDKIVIRHSVSGRPAVKELEKGNTLHQGGIIRIELN